MMAILLESLPIGIKTSVSCRSVKQIRTFFPARISLICWNLNLDVIWDILSSTLVKLFLEQKDSLNDRSVFFINFLHFYNDLICFHDNATLLIIVFEV